MRKGLNDIRPLMGQSEGTEISEKTVKEIRRSRRRLGKNDRREGELKNESLNARPFFVKRILLRTLVFWPFALRGGSGPRDDR